MLCNFRNRVAVLCLIIVIAHTQSLPSSEDSKQPDIHQVFTFKSTKKHDSKHKNDHSTSAG